MKYDKINVQIVDILLDVNNEPTKKYNNFLSGLLDYETIINDYFIDKQMESIKYNEKNQSICFTNQKEMITINEKNNFTPNNYYEEIHIHCNDLVEFDEFIEFLKQKYPDKTQKVAELPHYNIIKKEEFKDYELITEPITNEVDKIKSLINKFSTLSDRTIFQALALHYIDLVPSIDNIDLNIIRKLNRIYDSYIFNNENVIFSAEVSDKLCNLIEENKTLNISSMPSKNLQINSDYNIETKNYDY